VKSTCCEANRFEFNSHAKFPTNATHHSKHKPRLEHQNDPNPQHSISNTLTTTLRKKIERSQNCEMAFEVFDDVAFYWFLQVLLGIALIPLTALKIYRWCIGGPKHKRQPHPCVHPIPDYLPTKRLVEDKSFENKFSLKNIFFLLLWVVFILLLIQLPKWNNEQMIDYDPFQILETESGRKNHMSHTHTPQILKRPTHVNRCD